MKTNRLNAGWLMVLALAALNVQPSTAFAQGTAFTYQGRLNNNGQPAAGSYNLTFSLFNAGSGGSAVAGPVTNTGVMVTNGLFTVLIDFGPGPFTGAANWLEIGVATNGAGGFTTLAPRQELTPAPYAIYAEGVTASGIGGTLPAANFGGTYGSPVTFNNGADSFDGSFYGQFFGSTFIGGSFVGAFIGNGSGLTDLNGGAVVGAVAQATTAVTAGNLAANTNVTLRSAGTNFNYVEIYQCPLTNYIGLYQLVYSNTVSGSPWLVYRDLAVATNFISKNDPNEIANGWGPPSWAIGPSNDVHNADPFVTDGTYPYSDLPDAIWWEQNELTNYYVVANYLYASVPAVVWTNKFLWSGTSSTRYVNPDLGDDGNDGLTPITAFRSPYMGAAMSGATNATVILSAGQYANFTIGTSGFTFIGSGLGTVFTNGVNVPHAENWQDVSFPATLFGEVQAGETETIENCVLGSANSAIDALEPFGNSGAIIVRDSRLLSIWDTANVAGSGVYVFENDYQYPMNTLGTNYFGGTRVGRVNGIHVQDGAAVYLFGGAIIISNVISGQLQSSAQNTNCCILMDGPNSILYLGGTVLDNHWATNSTKIAFINGATTNQVRVFSTTWP